MRCHERQQLYLATLILFALDQYVLQRPEFTSYALPLSRSFVSNINNKTLSSRPKVHYTEGFNFSFIVILL